MLCLLNFPGYACRPFRAKPACPCLFFMNAELIVVAVCVYRGCVVKMKISLASRGGGRGVVIAFYFCGCIRMWIWLKIVCVCGGHQRGPSTFWKWHPCPSLPPSWLTWRASSKCFLSCRGSSFWTQTFSNRCWGSLPSLRWIWKECGCVQWRPF